MQTAHVPISQAVVHQLTCVSATVETAEATGPFATGIHWGPPSKGTLQRGAMTTMRSSANCMKTALVHKAWRRAAGCLRNKGEKSATVARSMNPVTAASRTAD